MLPVRGVDPRPVGDTVAPGPELEVLIGWNQDEASAFGLDARAVPEASRRVFIDPWLSWEPGHGATVSGYRLDWRPRGSRFGATHCLELALLLGNQTTWQDSPMLGVEPWDRVDALGRELRSVWAGFAHTGRIEPAAVTDLPVQLAPDGDLTALAVTD